MDDRAWVRKEDYLGGLALAQLAPGPLASQLAVHQKSANIPRGVLWHSCVDSAERPIRLGARVGKRHAPESRPAAPARPRAQTAPKKKSWKPITIKLTARKIRPVFTTRDLATRLRLILILPTFLLAECS